MTTAEEALARLRKGNRRFVDGRSGLHEEDFLKVRDELLAAQTPFAVILGCSDSRVPVEFVFDQGFGDLFVIRIAGNVVYPSQVGSVEFAVQEFGTALVVVLGHTNCGAIQGTVRSVRDGSAAPTESLGLIVERIRPAVEALADRHVDDAALVEAAVRANIRCSVEALLAESALLADKAGRGEIAIAGAEYCLASGEVTFLDEFADEADSRHE